MTRAVPVRTGGGQAAQTAEEIVGSPVLLIQRTACSRPRPRDQGLVPAGWSVSRPLPPSIRCTAHRSRAHLASPCLPRRRAPDAVETSAPNGLERPPQMRGGHDYANVLSVVGGEDPRSPRRSIGRTDVGDTRSGMGLRGYQPHHPRLPTHDRWWSTGENHGSLHGRTSQHIAFELGRPRPDDRREIGRPYGSFRPGGLRVDDHAARVAAASARFGGQACWSCRGAAPRLGKGDLK